MSGPIVRYDKGADVPHVVMDTTVCTYGEALPNFEDVVIVLLDANTDRMVGLQVLNAKRNGLREIQLWINKERQAFDAIRCAGNVPTEFVEGAEEAIMAQHLAEIDLLLTSVSEKAEAELATS